MAFFPRLRTTESRHHSPSDDNLEVLSSLDRSLKGLKSDFLGLSSLTYILVRQPLRAEEWPDQVEKEREELCADPELYEIFKRAWRLDN